MDNNPNPTTGVFIGRFQPFHSMHKNIVKSALEKVDKLIICIGSSDAARSSRNPWTAEERITMIKSACPDLVDRIIFTKIQDWPSDTRWLKQVREKVNAIVNYKSQIVLVGYAKDMSSFYLRLFPDWGSIRFPSDNPELSSTGIREKYFSNDPIWETDLESPVIRLLQKWKLTQDFISIREELEYCTAYKDSWSEAPFTPILVTADALVIQSGHILLIERGKVPGKGLLALPGGFINPNERVRDAAVRELNEETHISDVRGEIPLPVLAKMITDSKLVDNPYRSERGRVITHVFKFELPNNTKLFAVEGDDDAAKAGWFPVDQLTSEEFFEDHYTIIQEMLGL